MPSAKQTLRYLAISNFLIACVVILLQLAVLITLHQWVDWICIGFWGGILLFFAGGMALQKKKKVIFFIVLAMLSGLAMIGFYSWNVSVVDCKDFPLSGRSAVAEDDNGNDYNESLCGWRIASDVLFIIFGCCVLIVNMALAVKATSSNDSSVNRHPVNANADPHFAPQQATTYIITNSPPTNYPASAYPMQQTGQHAVNAAPYPQQQAPFNMSNQSAYPPAHQPSSPYEQPPPYNPNVHQKH